MFDVLHTAFYGGLKASGYQLPATSYHLAFGRYGQSVVIERAVAEALAGRVDPSERLLEEPGLRIALGDCSLHDIQLVLVHVDRGVGARLVLVVGELQLVAFDEVDVVPGQFRDPGITLHELPGRVDDRAGKIHLPIAGSGRTGRRRVALADLGASRARLGLLRQQPLDLVVIDHRQ